MKSFFKFNFLVAIACVVILGSCSDDDSEPTKTDAELIGSGVAWKFSTVTASGIDASSFIDQCYLDNLITFNYAVGVKLGVVNAGATKCDASEPQTMGFTWDYNQSTKVLTVDIDIIDIPGAEGDLTVKNVSASELVLSQDVSLAGFGTQEVILTLIH
jgi:hypothetical protein